MYKSNLPQTETKATGHHLKYDRPKSEDTGHFVRCVAQSCKKAVGMQVPPVSKVYHV